MMYQLARWVEQLTEKSHDSQNAAIIALQDRLIGHFPEITEEQAYDLLTELLLVMGASEESVWSGTDQVDLGAMTVDDSIDEIRSPHDFGKTEHPRVLAFELVQVMLNERNDPELLRKALVHRDFAEVRAQAAWSMGALKELSSAAEVRKSFVEGLRNALQDPELKVRMFAVSSLGELGSVRGEDLTEYLSSPDAMVKWLAHQALQTITLAQDSNVILYWVKLLTNDQESISYRALAATTLGDLGDQRAVPPLMAQLRDESETVRQFSALALGRLGNQAAVTPLFQTLIDLDEMVRYAAGTALAMLGDGRAVPFVLRARRLGDRAIQKHADRAVSSLGAAALSHWVQATRDEAMPYRNDATKIIANLNDTRAILVLVESLLDESIHAAARQGLLGLGESTVPALIYVVESDVSAVFKEHCINLLVEMEAKSSVPVLIKALGSESPSVKVLAAQSIGKLGQKKDAKTLLSHLSKAKDTDFIAELLLSLGRLGSKTAVSKLLSHIDHANSKVRGYAISALGELSATEAVEPLIERLNNPANDNRNLMIQALAKIGDERAVRPLLNLLEVARREAGIGVKGSYLGGTAIRALATLGEGSVVRLVLEEWEEEMESTLRLLGEAAQSQLEERLQHDRSPHIRALAAEGLGIVGSQSSLGSLITALNDQDKRVRDACAWSLQQIYEA